jgi:hypothetical protein
MNQQIEQILKRLSFEPTKGGNYIIVKFDDRIEYRNANGDLHRIDGPAIEWFDGTNSWWINGLRHREDGPAIEWTNGSKEWYINGKLHRTKIKPKKKVLDI